jgi:predicted metal-dependent phosphoesterase TrpH
MLRVEFHCHTRYSKDSLCSPEDLLAACQRKGVDRVVVTDHNNIQGALHAQKLDPQRVIVGEEIMTQDGELLAAFVTEEVPRDLPAEEAITRLRGQGAFISVSHPFDVVRSGHWERQALLRILPLVDAIETFNSRCWEKRYNSQAQAFAREHDILGTVGSDAHAAFEIGRATLLLPDFQDAESLRTVLPQAQVRTTLSSPFVHFVSTYAKWKKGA